MEIPKATGYFTPEASVTIHAPIELVWSILVDIEHYGEWNTFVPSMQSDFQVDSLLVMRVHMPRGYWVKTLVTITAIEPPHRLAWKTRFPHWLLHSERLQLLTALDTETTKYWTAESFGGLMAPLLKLLNGRDVQRGFESVAQNLKAHAEATGGLP